MSDKNGFTKSGYVSNETQRAALAARETTYWGPPKASLGRRFAKWLGWGAFVAAWVFVFYVCFA
jgi:hypothetical protein